MELSIDFLTKFIHAFAHYLQELWLVLALGFFISGLFHQFVPSQYIQRHLGGKGIKPILYSSFIGILLPVCCLGSLPIALTLRKKGASLGAALAFLVATPATSLSALFVSWKLLGTGFMLSIFFSAIFIAIMMGIVVEGVDSKKVLEAKKDDCCDSKHAYGNSILSKLRMALKYAFITMPKEMGFEIIMGISLASIITVFEPMQSFIGEYLTGIAGYGFILVFGLLSYVCSTASVPMADALVLSGMSMGQALCYLLVGPITSYGTLLVVRKDFGNHILIIYISIICTLSLMCGIISDIFIFKG